MKIHRLKLLGPKTRHRARPKTMTLMANDTDVTSKTKMMKLVVSLSPEVEQSMVECLEMYLIF